MTLAAQNLAMAGHSCHGGLAALVAAVGSLLWYQSASATASVTVVLDDNAGATVNRARPSHTLRR
jgi:hypothetical protein